MVSNEKSASFLERVRRSRKHAVGRSPQPERHYSSIPLVTTEDPSTASPSQMNLTFFDLPAELRNTIYDFMVRDTILTLPTTTSAVSKKTRNPLKRINKHQITPINGLLLASKQCRHEYQAVLLSTGIVNVDIKDFDFENLMRASSRLGPMESRALQSNPNLIISLRTQNCTTKGLMSLRRWLQYRGDHDDGLRWTYEFPVDLMPPSPMGKVRFLRELEYYADSILSLEAFLEHSQLGELQRVVDAFERQAGILEGEIGFLSQRTTAASRQVRGLAGGGLR